MEVRDAWRSWRVWECIAALGRRWRRSIIEVRMAKTCAGMCFGTSCACQDGVFTLRAHARCRVHFRATLGKPHRRSLLQCTWTSMIASRAGLCHSATCMCRSTFHSVRGGGSRRLAVQIEHSPFKSIINRSNCSTCLAFAKLDGFELSGHVLLHFEACTLTCFSMTSACNRELLWGERLIAYLARMAKCTRFSFLVRLHALMIARLGSIFLRILYVDL